MQARNAGGGGGGNDNAYDFLWVLALVMAVIIVTWLLAGKQIVQFFYQVTIYEIAGVQWVLQAWNHFAADWKFVPSVNLKGLEHLTGLLINHRLDTHYETATSVLNAAGIYLRYPAVIIILLLAALIYSRNVTAKFKTVLNMNRMKELERQNWPQIQPVAELNLVKEDINKGPWAMSMTPIQFCEKHNLFKERPKIDRALTGDLNRGLAHQVFVLQLGPLWTTPQALPIYAKALLASFAASANQERIKATNILRQINASAASGKLNFEGVEEFFAEQFQTKVVQKVLQQHAYILTIFATMLVLARTDGVFASSEFLWLKAVDRKMWYMLNSVGRQTAVPEVGGAYAHWLAEKNWGKALRTPMVEEAVRALEIALTEMLYEPEEND